MKFWNFKAKDKDTGELILYGEISSQSWWGDEVTPKQFKKDLEDLGDIKQLNIYINSGGGDVFAGQSIYTMLKRHQANKTVYVDGLAASIASVIAMAGDKVIMPANAMMMIHKAWTGRYGNADEFRKLADDLDKVDQSLISVYSAKTGIADDEIIAMMSAETWMTAEEAVDKGFADEIEASKKVAACVRDGALEINGQAFDLGRFKHAPQIELSVDVIETTQPGDKYARYEPVSGSEKWTLTKPENNPNDSGGASRPVSDTQKELFQNIRTKILEAYEKE